jgi:hypothetical protein
VTEQIEQAGAELEQQTRLAEALRIDRAVQGPAGAFEQKPTVLISDASSQQATQLSGS